MRGRAPFGQFGQLVLKAVKKKQNVQSPVLLKVGHHGSRYASTEAFLAAVQPRLALISVGRHNTFGHPAPQTLEALTKAGAQTFRTDQCGAIRVVADTSRVESLLCR